MRGDGFTFLKGQIWYIGYNFRGKQYQESSKSTDEKVAKRLLRQRLKQVGRPNFVDPAKEEKWTLADMKKVLVQDYERKDNRSTATMEHCFLHLEKAFEFHRVADINATKIREYAEKRLASGAARGTVNRSLAYLRRGFKLMFEAEMISRVPVIKMFEGETVRSGFIGVAEFSALLENIPDPNVRDVTEFLYNSGWRLREGLRLQWSWLDGNMVRLPREFSKSKKARALPLTGALMDIIERRKKSRRIDCPFVFHRSGKPIKSIRRMFKAAAIAAKHPDLLVHDMRRSAVRNFRRAGLSEHEGMALSGHLTDNVYRRYDIISDTDLAAAMERVQEHLKKEAQDRKVVPLKRESA